MEKCEICGKWCKNNNGLVGHFSKIHKISSKDYFIKYILNGVVPVCYCGKEVEFLSLGKGFQKYCSSKCSANSKELREKTKKTCQEKFGTDSPLQNEKVKEKIKETCQERFGVEHPAQSKIVQEKMKQTCNEKFGCDCPFQNEEVREKIKETVKNKFGVENISQSDEVKQKKKETCQEKFGTDFPLQNKEILEKQLNTMVERFGVKYSLQNEELKEKQINTCVEKFGVKNVLQNKEIKEKALKTMVEKYQTIHPLQNKELFDKLKKTNNEKFGCDNPLGNKEIKEKALKTLYENFGVKSPLQNKEVMSKLKKTNEERYGCENVLQNKEIKEKALKTILEINTKNAKKLFSKFDLEIIGEYEQNRKLLEFRCKICGSHFFDVPFNVSQRKHKCFFCDPTYRSHLEEEIKNEFEKIIFNKFNKNYIILTNDRKILSPYEIDILIPELNLSIEVNGDYWHALEKIEMRDIEKSKLMIKKGFKHFVVREFEWTQIRDYTFEKLDKLLEVDFETYLENKSYFTGFELLDDEPEEVEDEEM